MRAIMFAKRMALKQAERIEMDEEMDENAYEAGVIVKKLEREGVHGRNMYSDVVKMLDLGLESGAIEEKIRKRYGDQ